MRLLGFLKLPDINKGVEEYQATEGAVLIDVRDPEEYASGHIPGAINIPREEIAKAKELIPDLDIPLFTDHLGKLFRCEPLDIPVFKFAGQKRVGSTPMKREKLR